MARLDISQEKEFSSVCAAPIIILPICIFAIQCWLGSTGALLFSAEVDNSNFNTLQGTLVEGLIAQAIVFAIILILLVILLIRAKRKDKKNKRPISVYRTTEGIFDLDDPESILETIVLYQDYTSENLMQDIRQNHFCNRLLFVIFQKKGWIRYDGQDLFIKKGIDNAYFQDNVIRLLDSSMKAIALGEELLSEDYCHSLFVRQSNLIEETDTEIIYHINQISEYAKEIRDCLKESAEDIVKNWDKTNASKFKSGTERMLCHGYTYKDISEMVENKVRLKYVDKGKGKTANDRVNPIFVAAGSSILFVILLFAVYFIYAISVGFQVSVDFFLGIMIYAESVNLAILATYIRLMREESEEKLTPEGQEIVDKVAGLKMFIKDYTQLKNPSSDKLYKVWDEFVLFAYIFGLNSQLYWIAKENNMQYQNEELLDYFNKNDDLYKILLKINDDVARCLPYPYRENLKKYVAYHSYYAAEDYQDN